MYPPQSPLKDSKKDSKRNSNRDAQSLIPKLANRLSRFCHSLLNPSQNQKRIAFFCVGLCLVSLASPFISPADAQVTQAKVQEILDGNQVFIQNKRAALNDIAKQRQQVRTGNSRTSLVFNTGAVARLSANSVLQIGQCAQLRRGTILVNGAVNACSASITAGVRGTTYLLEVDESGSQQIKVLEGEVLVKRNTTPLEDFDEDDQDLNSDDPANPSGEQRPTPNPAVNDNSTKPATTKPTTKPNTAKPTTNPTTVRPVTDPKTTNPSLSTPKQTIPKTSPSNNPATTIPTQQNLPTPPVSPTEPTPPANPTNSTDPADEVLLKAGEKVEVSDRGILGVVQELSENEFVGLLTGSLFQGFTNQIPSLDKIRSVFNLRFPNINFPIPNLPSIPGLPSLPSFPSFPF